MKPVDAIEFALRLNRGSLRIGELLEVAAPFVHEDGFDRKRLKQVVDAHPKLFKLGADDICFLQDERLADRRGFYREQLAGLRDALRSMPFSNSIWTEVALVFALAVRKPDQLPLLSDRASGLWPILNELVLEFPQLDKQVSYQLRNSHDLFVSRAQGHLLAMESARVSRSEIVQELMHAVLRDGANGRYATPWWVGQLMTQLLGEAPKMVFDPEADSNVTSILLSERSTSGTVATSMYWSSTGAFIGKMLERLMGVEADHVMGSEEGAYARLPEHFDHSICIPSFGGREVVMTGPHGEPMTSVEAYEVAINQIMKRLSPKGRAVVLVQESALFSENRVHFRRSLIETGGLSFVISLPPLAFRPQVQIKTSILVFDRSTLDQPSIRFVNATPYIKKVDWQEPVCDMNSLLGKLHGYDDGSRNVLVESKRTLLESDQTILSMEHHVAQMAITESVAAEPETRFVALKELLTDIPREGSKRLGAYFQVTELSADIMELKRTALDGRDDPATAAPGKVVTTPALLLARVGGRLKPTLFDPIDGPITVGSNVFAFQVDTGAVDPEYLALELGSERIQRQVDLLAMGVAIASISNQALLSIQVRLPPLNEQRRIFKERVEGILIAQRQVLDAKAKERGLSISEWQLLGAVEHSLRPVATQVETPLKQIRKVLPSIPDPSRTMVEQAVLDADDALKRMKAMFKTIHQVVRSDKASMVLAPFDLRRLFRNEVRALGEIVKNLDVYFHCDPELESPEGVIAIIDRDQFALVVQNLFTNMAKHSGASAADKICVRIDVSHRAEGARRWLVIQAENNGEYFPDGFTHQDFITPGKLGDPAKGSGLGGFLMDRIIANHGGRFASGNLPFGENCFRLNSREERITSGTRSFWDQQAWMAVNFTIELPLDTDPDA